MKTYLSNDRLLYFLRETKTEIYFRHIFVYAYVITFSKVCFLLLLDNLLGGIFHTTDVILGNSPSVRLIKTTTTKKWHICLLFFWVQTERFIGSLAKVWKWRMEIELGILAQEEDTILKLGRRANAKVWGAKRVRKGGGKVS